MLREDIAAGDIVPQMANELHHLEKGDRQAILRHERYDISVSPEEAVAMKANLGLSWSKTQSVSR